MGKLSAFYILVLSFSLALLANAHGESLPNPPQLYDNKKPLNYSELTIERRIRQIKLYLDTLDQDTKKYRAYRRYYRFYVGRTIRHYCQNLKRSKDQKSFEHNLKHMQAYQQLLREIDKK